MYRLTTINHSRSNVEKLARDHVNERYAMCQALSRHFPSSEVNKLGVVDLIDLYEQTLRGTYKGQM